MNLCTMLKLWRIAWNFFTHITAPRCVNVQSLKAFSIVRETSQIYYTTDYLETIVDFREENTENLLDAQRKT